MSVSLAEALGQVDLQAGQIYRCNVNGHQVELRVLDEPRERMPSSIDESDIMLDPWVELPRPPAVATVLSRFGPLPLPSVPEIPEDWDEI
jgi:hypothetical protein